MTIDTIEDDGFFKITYRRADAPDAPPVEKTLDTIEVFERLRAIVYREVMEAERDGRTTDIDTPMRDFLNEKFGLNCSASWAGRFYTRLRAEAERLKKKDLSPDSAEIPRPLVSPSGPTDQSPTPPA